MQLNSRKYTNILSFWIQKVMFTNFQNIFIQLQTTNKMEKQFDRYKLILDISDLILITMEEESEQAHKTPIIETIQEVQVDKVSTLDTIVLLTPYLYLNQQNNNDSQLNDFQLDENERALDNIEQQSVQEDIEDGLNRSQIESEYHQNILDKIEQECEKNLRYNNQVIKINIFFEDKKAKCAQLDDLKNVEYGSQLNQKTIPETEFKYYNFLSFKENTIEFYNQGNAKYLNETRKTKVQRYLKKRKNRCWGKKISYFCRKQVADNRLRVKGRFITRNQANKLLKMDTYSLSLQEIKDLLQSKLKKQELQSMSLEVTND